MVAIWTLTGEGEVFGKMAASRSRKILSEVRILRREKWRWEIHRPMSRIWSLLPILRPRIFTSVKRTKSDIDLGKDDYGGDDSKRIIVVKSWM